MGTIAAWGIVTPYNPICSGVDRDQLVVSLHRRKDPLRAWIVLSVADLAAEIDRGDGLEGLCADNGITVAKLIRDKNGLGDGTIGQPVGIFARGYHCPKLKSVRLDVGNLVRTGYGSIDLMNLWNRQYAMHTEQVVNIRNDLPSVR